MNPRDRLLFSILYGSGLRISECMRIRIMDTNFSNGSLTVRKGKGNKDRTTILSTQLFEPIKDQIQRSLTIQVADNIKGYGPSLPHALGKKFPSAY